jgi:hypothetical protein
LAVIALLVSWLDAIINAFPDFLQHLCHIAFKLRVDYFFKHFIWAIGEQI